MKLVDSGKNIEKESKNGILFALIAIVSVTIIVVLVLLMMMQKKNSIADDSGIWISNAKSTISMDEIKSQDGVPYYPIDTFAKELGYEFNRGEYKISSEDTDKCYIKNSFETVTFFENSSIIYKMDVESDPKTTDYKEFDIQYPVLNIDGKLYISKNGLQKACNVEVTYDNDGKKVQIYTLDDFANAFDSAAKEKGYTTVSDKNYENKKMMLKGVTIVKGSSNQYGMIDYNGNEIMGVKYSKIQYDEYTDLFNITDTYGKVGIWKVENSAAKPIVANEYDTIEIMDKEKQLYLVTSNQKYGVVNANGQMIIPVEYDAIGVDASKYYITNGYILYDRLIPVKKNNKWGIMDIEGNIIYAVEYDGVGCSKSSVGNSQPAIIVPEYGIIVLYKDNNYGLVNWQGKQVINFALSTVYYSNAYGSRRAYMESEGQVYDIVDYLDKNGTFEKYDKAENFFDNV